MRKALMILSVVILFSGCGGGGSDNGGSGTVNPAVTIPLLANGTHYGIIDEATAPAGAFGECITRGQSIYELSSNWNELESTEGNFTLATFTNQLQTTKAAGLVPYVVIRTVNTTEIEAPAYLMDGGDPNNFIDDHFSAARVITRFKALLDQVVPLIVQNDGFAISVSNEVDIWLSANPDELSHFLTFLRQAREHIHSINPNIAVGATFTYEGLRDHYTMVSQIAAESDVVFFSYYPMSSGDVISPAQVATHMDEISNLAGFKQILIQECGFPSSATVGSSEELQRQWVENLFTAVAARPRIRMVNIVHLADWTTAQVDTFVGYYDNADPKFRAFLDSLGLHDQAGNPKTAYAQFLTGLDTYAP